MPILPGQTTAVLPNDEWGTMCQDHPTVAGVVKLCTEADSFGEEYVVLCQSCLDEYRKDKKEREEVETGSCDQCRAEPLLKDMYTYRDIDEGSNGPVYHVCGKCYQKYQDYLSREAGYDDDDY